MPDGPLDEPYRVYTDRYDLVQHASEIELTLASSSLDGAKGWLHGRGAWEDAIRRVESLRSEHDAEFVRLGARARAMLEQSGIERHQVAACLLIDLSGSMKGEPIAATAATVVWLTDILGGAGAKVEILGFSTAGWQGGYSYQAWRQARRPKRPGRLCALRHVVFKSADEALTDVGRRVLVHPDLLRENVDGEALLWAAGRLEARPEPIKLLVIVSDGAPVDDATLVHNGVNYLHRHLVACIEALQARNDLLLGAVGVGYGVEEFYSLSTSATELAALPAAFVELLEKMIVASRERLKPVGGDLPNA